ncbi:MAG: hypothetical protein J1F23_01225 [Oscillospiraceae bacterium]|nr:hypothetical protein [Oscillospiraceae bacterium]
MVKVIKRISGCTAFILILALLLILSSYILSPKSNEKAAGMENATANGILGERENSIDVLVLGDSEAYASISPMQMWEEYGFTSYVCSSSAQYLSYTEILLKRAFQNQSPKVVLLEANAIYRETSFMNSLAINAENLISVFKYHNRWKTLRINDFYDSVEYTWTDDYKGFNYSKTVLYTNNTNYMIETDKAAEIQLINENSVKSIAEFCKEHGAEFFLFSAPSAKNWTYEKHNGVQKLADKYNITYVDLNLMHDEIPIDWKTDTKDQGDHVNYYGAVKTTKFIGKYLNYNYQLPDHREDDEYAAWNEALIRYLKTVEE